MDLIDRQAAIEALNKEINKGIPPFNDVMGSIRCGVRLARNIIEDLPTAEPKTGRWMFPDPPIHKPICSECGKPCIGLHAFEYALTNYCPNCGARMEGEEDGRSD